MKFVKTLLLSFFLLTIFSCQESGPKDFALQKDQCDNCKMTITDLPYATQLITEKGRLYKFDDISCMTMYENSEAEKVAGAKKYVVDFPSKKIIELPNATLIQGGSIKSPMGGDTQAFESKDAATKAAAELGASLVN